MKYKYLMIRSIQKYILKQQLKKQINNYQSLQNYKQYKYQLIRNILINMMLLLEQYIQWLQKYMLHSFLDIISIQMNRLWQLLKKYKQLLQQNIKYMYQMKGNSLINMLQMQVIQLRRYLLQQLDNLILINNIQ